MVLEIIQKYAKGKALEAQAIFEMGELETEKVDLWMEGYESGLTSASWNIDLMIERLDEMNISSEHSVIKDEN